MITLIISSLLAILPIAKTEAPPSLASVATQYMIAHGVPADSISIKKELSQGPVHVFSNNTRRGGFVVMADSTYHDVLPELVLAYSSRGYGAMRYQPILDYYAKCLEHLRASGQPDMQMLGLTSGWTSVAPLLKSIEWAQNKIQAKFADKEINVWAGCVSTAEAQLLRYWRFPQRAHGTVWFDLGQLNEQMFMYNLGHTKFDWQILSPQYPRTQEERDARDRLQAVCGMTLFPKYGEDETPAYLRQIKYSLVNHFGYAPTMHFLQVFDDRFSTLQLLHAIYDDLRAKRPVPVSIPRHAVVVDGYDDGMFHINFGWGGYCNGFYRQFTFEPLILQGIVGIQPDNSSIEDTGRVIEIKKAGTLGKLLPEDEAMQYRSITIKGKLDGDDIKLLRRMAGAVDYNNPTLPTGSLQHLDLSQAEFKASKHPYMTLTGQQAHISGRVTRTETITKGEQQEQKHFFEDYDTRNLTHKKFRALQDFDLENKHGFILQEVKPDSLYLVHYMLPVDRLPRRIFQDCDNLKSIVLGKNITGVDNYAFNNCASLGQITLLSRNITFANGAFFGLTRLRHLCTYSRFTLDKKMFANNFYSTISMTDPE